VPIQTDEVLHVVCTAGTPCPSGGIWVPARPSLALRSYSRLAWSSICSAAIRPAPQQGASSKSHNAKRPSPVSQPGAAALSSVRTWAHTRAAQPAPPNPHRRLAQRGQRIGEVRVQEVLNRKVPRKGSFAGFFSCDPTCHRWERTLHSSKQINNSFRTLTWRLTLPINSLISCCRQGSPLPCGCLSIGAWSRAILSN